MRGQSRPKDGVASLAYAAHPSRNDFSQDDGLRVSKREASASRLKPGNPSSWGSFLLMDARVKPAHDESRETIFLYFLSLTIFNRISPLPKSAGGGVVDRSFIERARKIN
jgi:hypothetical protein